MLAQPVMCLEEYEAGARCSYGGGEQLHRRGRGIDVRVHPGSNPHDPGDGTSFVASNFVQVFKADLLTCCALQLGRTMRLKAGKAVTRGRDVMVAEASWWLMNRSERHCQIWETAKWLTVSLAAIEAVVISGNRSATSEPWKMAAIGSITFYGQLDW